MKVRACLLGLMAGSILAVTIVPAAQAQDSHAHDAQGAEGHRFDLPAEALSDALVQAAGAAHVTLAFSPDLVAGKRSPALHGVFPVAKAFDLLLAGTGLTVTVTHRGSYIIEGAAEPAARAGAVIVARTRETVTQTVIVHSFRASVIQSLAVRRAYSGGLESIAAEDIAKFPDNNVAEAIERVAGVAISRDQGEGRSITVRGLGPEFTGIEINNISAQAATGGPGQGINRGRGFDFNVFPSELFSRIDVRKTSEADQPEGSLGATVILYTPHPFDHPGLRLAASAQTTYNDQSEKTGRRGGFFISDTFDHNRFGALLSVAWSDTPLDIQGVNSGDWNQGTANGGFCRPTTGTGGLCDVPAADLGAALAAYDLANRSTTYHPQFYRYTELTGQVDRIGADLSLQWRPSEQTTISLDGLYSRFKTRREDHFLEAIGFSRGASQGGKPEIVPRSVALDGNGVMTYGLFDNVDVRSELAVNDFETDFSQVSLLVKHKINDKLMVEATLGGSRSAFDNADNLTVQMDRFNVDGYAFDTRTTGRDRPAITYGFDVTDPANWYFGPRVTQPGGTGPSGPEIRLRPNYVYDDNHVLLARLTYDPSAHYRLTAGIQARRYANRDVSYRFDEGEADFPAPGVPLSQLTRTFCGLGTVAPPAGTPRCWLEPDVDAFARAYDLFADTGKTALSATNPAARGLNQAVTEDEFAAFGKIWFRQSLFGRPIRGDIGLRAVETRQAVDFYANVPTAADPGGYALTSTERTYADLLPSLNIVYESTKTSLWRLSAAQVMARPPLEYLNGASTVTVNGGLRTVMTGNPNLAPYRATTLDLSYEWYRTPGGIAAIGLFYKNISSYIQVQSHIAPYATTGLPAALLANTGAAPGDDFAISTVANTHGGPLDGVELNYQAPLRFLPGRWSKLGVLLNYTYVLSRITYPTTSASGPTTIRADLMDLSRSSYNATLYYDGGKFQARVSTNYRDKYLTAIPGQFNADASGVNAAQFWDGSMSYKVTPHLAVTFEAQNLTNEKSETWDNRTIRLVDDMTRSGRSFALGVRYTY